MPDRERIGQTLPVNRPLTPVAVFFPTQLVCDRTRQQQTFVEQIFALSCLARRIWKSRLQRREPMVEDEAHRERHIADQLRKYP